jgi:hypothetical protein
LASRKSIISWLSFAPLLRECSCASHKRIRRWRVSESLFCYSGQCANGWANVLQSDCGLINSRWSLSLSQET